MKERVRRAIQHLPTDRVPKGEISIDDAVVKRELECSSVGFEERLQFANKLELLPLNSIISPILHLPCLPLRLLQRN